jgi:integrase
VTFKGFGSVKQTPPEFSGCDEIRDVRTGCAQTLICRSNWIDVMKFLDYIREVQQRATSTINSKRGSLQHLLRWAYDKPFAQCENMLPTFPNYLETVPVVYNYRPSGTFLLYKTREKACTNARQFLRWAMAGLPDRYGAMDRFWIDSLTPGPRREYSNDRRPFTIEEVRKIVMLPADSLRMRRDIAAVACIFLTGLRVGAFTTLPVTAFDFDAPVPTISQFPELGVETKNRRSAKTYALTIPDILQVVIHWHTFISDELGPNALWYARLTPRGESLDCDNTTSSGAGNRGGTVSRGLKMLCERAEVEYRSAHNLRHGHATYALSLAKGESERKHISQNLMHASLEVTERTYNNPSPAQVQRTIAAISRRTQGDQIETVTVEKIEGMIDTAVRNAMPMALFKTVLIACWYLLQMVRNVFNVLVRSGHDGDG